MRYVSWLWRWEFICCVRVCKGNNVTREQKDLLEEARKIHGDIGPLHDDWDDSHFTRDYYKGGTWIAVWFQIPNSDSTGCHRKQIGEGKI